MSRSAAVLVVAVLAAGCSSPAQSPDAGATAADAGASVALGLAQAVALTQSFKVATIDADGTVAVSRVEWFGFEALRGKALLVESIAPGGGFSRLEAATGASVELPVDGAAQFAGENALSDLVFSDGTAFRAQTKVVERFVPGNVADVMFLARNHAVVRFLNGSYEIADTATGKHYPCDAPSGLASLGADRSMFSGGQVVDMATGALHKVAAWPFFFDQSLADTQGSLLFGGSCPGGGVCSMGEAEVATALLSSAVDLRLGVRSVAADGRFVVMLERNASQASLVVRGTDAKQAILKGIDVEDFDVLDPWMLYVGLDQQGAKVLGRVDLSTLVDTRLSPPEEVRQVRFLRP